MDSQDRSLCLEEFTWSGITGVTIEPIQFSKLVYHILFYDSLGYILLFELGGAVYTAEEMKDSICDPIIKSQRCL